MLSSSASRSLSSLWRWVTNPPSLHIIEWSTLKMSPLLQIVQNFITTGFDSGQSRSWQNTFPPDLHKRYDSYTPKIRASSCCSSWQNILPHLHRLFILTTKYPESRSFSAACHRFSVCEIAWYFGMKQTNYATDKRSTRTTLFVNVKIHAREKPLLAG